MPSISYILRNVWVRLILVSSIVFISVFSTVLLLNTLIFDQMRLDIRDAKRGISRYEYELEKLEKELSVLEEKMTKKSTESKNMYSHYYTLYRNPLRYVNKFFLIEAKPPGVIITGSSVFPNSTFKSLEKELLRPYLSSYGISRIKNIGKIFSLVIVKISARGAYSDIGQFIYNIYSLPVKFSLREFEVRQNDNGISLTMEIVLISYRLPDDYK